MKETKLKLRLFPDPILRKKASLVKEITPWHLKTLDQMAKIMYESSGIGLAANQVGLTEAMIVVDVGRGLYKLINPKILKKEGSQIMEEGCLSIPGICIKVKRAKKILVSAQDEKKKPFTLEAQDLLACVLQHEIDHLKGKVILDYASFWEKFKIRKKLKELKRLKDEELHKSETKSCQLQL